jgi:competence protein ComEA
MPAQRAHRHPDVNDRLERMKSAKGEHHPSTEPDWIDETSPVPEPEEGTSPWWRRAEPGRLVERWLPGGLPARSRRKWSVAVVIGLALGTAVTVAVLLSSTGSREPPSALPVAKAALPDSADPEPPHTEPPIVVSVVGRVLHPGLVTLPGGSRVDDAVRAAGGPQPGVDLTGLNLARRLTDGEQVSVGVPAAEPAPAVAGMPEKVDLNSATLTQLDTLPGVGSVTAQRILDWRGKHGHFTRIDQLRDIDGIGPARFGQLKDLVVVR